MALCHVTLPYLGGRVHAVAVRVRRVVPAVARLCVVCCVLCVVCCVECCVRACVSRGVCVVVFCGGSHVPSSSVAVRRGQRRTAAARARPSTRSSRRGAAFVRARRTTGESDACHRRRAFRSHRRRARGWALGSARRSFVRSFARVARPASQTRVTAVQSSRVTAVERSARVGPRVVLRALHAERGLGLLERDLACRTCRTETQPHPQTSPRTRAPANATTRARQHRPRTQTMRARQHARAHDREHRSHEEKRKDRARRRTDQDRRWELDRTVCGVRRCVCGGESCATARAQQLGQSQGACLHKVNTLSELTVFAQGSEQCRQQRSQDRGRREETERGGLLSRALPLSLRSSQRLAP